MSQKQDFVGPRAAPARDVPDSIKTPTLRTLRRTRTYSGLYDNLKPKPENWTRVLRSGIRLENFRHDIGLCAPNLLRA